MKTQRLKNGGKGRATLPRRLSLTPGKAAALPYHGARLCCRPARLPTPTCPVNPPTLNPSKEGSRTGRARSIIPLLGGGRGGLPRRFLLCTGVRTVVLLTSLMALCLSARADFTLNWFTQDGGGGRSSAGAYTAHITIGQPDATTTPLTGGGYTIHGGFWVPSIALPSNAIPVVKNLTLGVNVGAFATLPVMGGKHSPTDANGDRLVISAVTQGAHGTVGIVGGTNLTYQSTGSATSDSFTYTVSDGRGANITATVSVMIFSPQGFNQLAASVSNNVFTLTYLGIPGYAYAVEHATNLTPPIVWTPVATNQAATNGYLIFNVTSTNMHNYFRTRSVP